MNRKYCLVHMEPERFASDIDYQKMGKVSRLAFYVGGNSMNTLNDRSIMKECRLIGRIKRRQ